MSLRKNGYFKMLCLFVAVLFTGQCISYERNLISTEEKVIENGNYYVYELEKIKTPSAQDPTVEYRIVRFPAKKIEVIDTHQLIRKNDHFLSFLGGAIVGGVVGSFLGYSLKHQASVEHMGNVGWGFILGTLGGGIGAASIGDSEKTIKSSKPGYLQKKKDSIAIPAPYFPLEFKLIRGKKAVVFKTQTNEQGIVKLHLFHDLKIPKYPLDQSLRVYIHYLNPESQQKGLLKDTL
jgi:hypothetical protein